MPTCAAGTAAGKIPGVRSLLADWDPLFGLRYLAVPPYRHIQEVGEAIQWAGLCARWQSVLWWNGNPSYQYKHDGTHSDPVFPTWKGWMH